MFLDTLQLSRCGIGSKGPEIPAILDNIVAISAGSLGGTLPGTWVGWKELQHTNTAPLKRRKVENTRLKGETWKVCGRDVVFTDFVEAGVFE